MLDHSHPERRNYPSPSLPPYSSQHRLDWCVQLIHGKDRSMGAWRGAPAAGVSLLHHTSPHLPHPGQGVLLGRGRVAAPAAPRWSLERRRLGGAALRAQQLSCDLRSPRPAVLRRDAPSALGFPRGGCCGLSFPSSPPLGTSYKRTPRLLSPPSPRRSACERRLRRLTPS